MSHKTVALVILLGLFGASTVSGQSAAIKKNDGSSVVGEISGQVVLAQAVPRMAVINGKDIEKIDEAGVHLRPGVIVIVAGMPARTDPKVYKSTKPIDVLTKIMPLANKTIVAQRIDEILTTNIEQTGVGDGPGVGTMPITGGRVYFIKQIRSETPPYPVVGELRLENGVLAIQPALRVTTASGPISVPVESIVAAKNVKK